ncbi:MAG: hypothetical protein R3C68_00345 [Myxococcota bacterium]
MSETPIQSDMLDVYVSYNPVQTDRILELLLSAGIEPLLRDRSSSAFPISVGGANAQLIAIPENQVERTRMLIRTAREDGVIDDEGEFL